MSVSVTVESMPVLSNDWTLDKLQKKKNAAKIKTVKANEILSLWRNRNAATRNNEAKIQQATCSSTSFSNNPFSANSPHKIKIPLNTIRTGDKTCSRLWEKRNATTRKATPIMK